jgi:hypothetical protein
MGARKGIDAMLSSSLVADATGKILQPAETKEEIHRVDYGGN